MNQTEKMAAPWTDHYLREENGARFITYRSGLAVYQERLSGGSLEPVGWRGNGIVPESILTWGSPRLNPGDFLKSAAFSIDADGICLDGMYDWAGLSHTEDGDRRHIQFRLNNRMKPIDVTVHTVLDGTAILNRWLTIKNTGEDSLSLTRLTVMGGALTAGRMLTRSESPFELGYMNEGQTLNEGDFHWMNLPRSTFSFGKQLYTERYRHPFFTVRDRTNADTFIAQFGYNGGYRCSFHNRVDMYRSAYLSFEMEAASRPPIYTLGPGEEMETPSMHIGIVHGGFDAAVQEMIRHTRLYFGGNEPCSLIESAIGPEIDMSEIMVRRAIDNAAEIGAELFWIDASWYSPEGGERDWPAYTGDWEPKQSRYTSSIRDLGNYARSKNMLFGLWVDIEKMGHSSQALRNPAIPKLRGYDGAITPDGSCGILDLSAPEGLKWAYETISGLINRHDLDFFRLDSGAYSFTSVSDNNGVTENRDLRYHANLCALFKRLREEFPRVIFQNCAGGGSRLGLDLMRYMSDTQISDWASAPKSFSIFNGVSMFLPMEYLFAFIGTITDCRSEAMDFFLNIAHFGHICYGYTLPSDIEYNPIFRGKIRNTADTFKRFIRPMLKDSRIFHHTPDLDMEKPGAVGVLEMASESGECAVLGIFALNEPTSPVYRAVFKGLTSALDYEVYINDEYYCVMRGCELLQTGLSVELPTALDSKVIIAKALQTLSN